MRFGPKAKHHVLVNTAAIDVLDERRRQIEAEGYGPEHDDEHVNDEIAALACFYAMPPGAREWDTSSTGYGLRLGDAILPHGWASIEDGDRRSELVKAGALILAEIERMDRSAAVSKSPGTIPTTSILVGQILVMADLLKSAIGVVRTIPGDTTEESDLLQTLIDQSEAAIATVLTEHAMGGKAHG